MIRVFLVDDQELVRAGFAMILNAAPDITVAGSAGDGESALAAPALHTSDVVLMDITMPGLDGIATTRRLLDDPAAPRVVMLTTFDSDDNLIASLRAGASGFLAKDAGPEQLLAAVRAATAGDAPVAPRLVRRLIDLFVLDPDQASAPGHHPARPSTSGHNPAQPPAPGHHPARPSAPGPKPDPAQDGDGFDRLTPREREILAAVGLGLTNAEIAARLFVAESTVKTHFAAVLRKLQLRDRIQAVIAARRLS